MEQYMISRDLMNRLTHFFAGEQDAIDMNAGRENPNPVHYNDVREILKGLWTAKMEGDRLPQHYDG